MLLWSRTLQRKLFDLALICRILDFHIIESRIWIIIWCVDFRCVFRKKNMSLRRMWLINSICVDATVISSIIIVCVTSICCYNVPWTTWNNSPSNITRIHTQTTTELIAKSTLRIKKHHHLKKLILAGFHSSRLKLLLPKAGSEYIVIGSKHIIIRWARTHFVYAFSLRCNVLIRGHIWIHKNSKSAIHLSILRLLWCKLLGSYCRCKRIRLGMIVIVILFIWFGINTKLDGFELFLNTVLIAGFIITLTFNIDRVIIAIFIFKAEILR